MPLIELPKKNELSFRNKTATKAELTIYGPIGSDWFESGITAKQVSELIKNNQNIKELDIRLNSPGGDVFEGIAIYNRLKQWKDVKKTVYVDGLGASIASVIMLAGDEIIMGEGALVMIHKPWTWAAGNSNDLEEVIARLDDVEEQILGIYARCTKKDRAELRSLVAKETWFDADEAVEMGFATRKMAEDDEKVAVAASLKAPWINKAPTSLAKQNNLVKNKIEELKSSIEGFLAR